MFVLQLLEPTDLFSKHRVISVKPRSKFPTQTRLDSELVLYCSSFSFTIQALSFLATRVHWHRTAS